MMNQAYEYDRDTDSDSKKSVKSDGENKTLPIRFEDLNKNVLIVFKILGIYLIRWDKDAKAYVVLKIRYFLFYTFWFIWPLAGLLVALMGKNIFGTYDDSDNVNNVIESSLFILGFAVIPALKTYSLKLITRCLPDVLEDMVDLQDLDTGFETPLKVSIPSWTQKIDAVNYPNTAAGRASRKKISDPEVLFRVLPIVTVVVSTVAFVTAWVWGLTQVIEWEAVKNEWPFFIMQFSYMTLPCITTWFSVLFVEWQRMVYEKLRIEVECTLYSRLHESTNEEGQIQNYEKRNAKIILMKLAIISTQCKKSSWH